jgi:nitrite reductase/ring-hydroxylating ferredoxin subunit
MSRTAQRKYLPAHLFSATGKFLGSPASISPERVMGVPTDARSDVYALGVLLFELLSGTPPFSGTDPLEIALQRLQQSPPALHTLCPDLPPALDDVVSQAMAREPAQRYAHAGDIVAAFERSVHSSGTGEHVSATKGKRVIPEGQITLPPTVNWFDEELLSPSRGEVHPRPLAAGGTSVKAPIVTPEPEASIPSPHGTNPQLAAGVDPFALWSATAVKAEAPTPGTFTRRPTVNLSTGRSRRRPHQPGQMDRRRLVKLVVVGTVAAGVLGIGGLSFENFLRSVRQSPSGIASLPATGSTQTTQSTQSTQQTTQGTTPGVTPTQGTQTTPTPGAGKTPTPGASSTPQPSPTAHATPTPKPTPKPTPTPPPSHTGTVIGYTNQATNSYKTFTNPADGQGSLLIHLANGNFVACERACTHAGVPVNYDSGSQQITCPAHGAVFDPLNGFAHLSGPGNGSLPTVKIRVNPDGTITTG